MAFVDPFFGTDFGFPSLLSSDFFPSREFWRPSTAQRAITGRPQESSLSTPVRGSDLATDNWWRPRTDMFFDEERNEIRVELELPGIPLENINLECDGNSLIVSSYKSHSRTEDRGLFYVTERHFGNFYRRLELAYRVDPERIDAHIKDGVLKIHMPILSSAGKRTKIQIGGGGERRPLSAGGEGPQEGEQQKPQQQQQQQQQEQQQQQQQEQQEEGKQGKTEQQQNV